MSTIGFYDIHTHILPGVDDGAASMQETVNMLQKAHTQGIKTIIATPHYRVRGKNLPVEELLVIREQVEVEAKKLDKDFRILLGNELYYSDSVIDALNTKQALTLAGSKYVLVEFGFGESYKQIYRGLDKLIQNGYLPVLAHVERYSALQRSASLIHELIELGCYIQMNCNSLIGGLFHSKAAFNRKLVENGLIHFLGSDCHDEKVRIPNMKSAVEVLSKKCEGQVLNRLLYDNPIALLNNTTI